MADRMTKEELLNTIRVKRRQLERYLFHFEKNDSGEFIASDRPKFSREEMLQSGVVHDWSIKDLLASLIDQESQFIDWCQAGVGENGLDTTGPEFRTADRNSKSQPTSEEPQLRSLEELLIELPKSFHRTLDTVNSLSERELFTSGQYPRTGKVTLADIVARSTWKQYDWAKKHIRRWRRTHAGQYLNKKVVLERIRVERRRLEKRLADLTEKQMVVEGVVGEWSVKDILAHLVDWEQRFQDWYRAGLRGEVPEIPAPGLSWGELDILNHQIYIKHRGRDLDDIVAEFHRSYDQVLTTIEAIPEEDMFRVGKYLWLGEGNLLGYILANTANHYRWAKTQIHRWMKAPGNL